MKDTKLLRVLKHLLLPPTQLTSIDKKQYDKKELKALKSFITSPFFSTNENVY